MKKKFNTFYLLILFLLIFNKAYALDSRCEALYKNIKNNQLNLIFDELDYFPQKFRSIDFDLSYDLKNNDYGYSRDKNNNLIIGRIWDEKLFSEIIDNEKKIIKQINIGDKIISINGKKVNNLTDVQINNLLEEYYDPELQLDNLEFEILNSFNNKIKYKPKRIQFNNHAEAYVELNIKNISNVDEKANSFEADLSFIVYWNMKNLYPLSKDSLIVDKDKSKYRYCNFSPKEFEEMQIGEVFFEITNSIVQNENLIKDEYEFNISDYYYSSKILDENTDKFVEIKHKKKGNFTFANTYNLKAFPFDRQLLKIQIVDPTRDISMLSLNTTNWMDLMLDNFKNNSKILEWKIISTKSNYFNYSIPLSDEIYSGVEITIEIERDYQYYVFKVISPIVLILLVCWSVFWIHPRELESKLTITIVCLLSLIAYNFVIDEDLPKLSYLTIIDYVILLAYIFATIPSFLSIYSFQNWSAKKTNWKYLDKKSRIFGPLTFVTLVLFIIFINSFNNQYTSAFLGFLNDQ